MSKVLIVGAAMGGLRTAESLRRFGYSGEITIVGGEKHLPYNRPPLSKDLLAQGKDFDAVAFPIKDSELKAEFILADPATSLLCHEKRIYLASGRNLEYDYLVAATGLRSRQMNFPNNLKLGRYNLRTFDDAKAIGAAATPKKKVVILGAGFIGLELAATLRTLGCSVAVVALEAIPLSPILGDDFGLAVQKRHEKEGVQFHLNRSVQDLIGDQRISGVLLSNGEILECDFLIEAVGSQTNTEWLEGNNLDIGNGVLTDNSLRAMRIDKSRVEDLFVVGDIARFPYVNIALPARRIEHWNIPVECGKRVGREIAAKEGSKSSSDLKQDEHFNPLPSFWSEQFSISILSYGEPKIADTISLLEGSLDSEFIFEYRREGSVVAVAGIGMRRKISALREEIRL